MSAAPLFVLELDKGAPDAGETIIGWDRIEVLAIIPHFIVPVRRVTMTKCCQRPTMHVIRGGRNTKACSGCGKFDYEPAGFEVEHRTTHIYVCRVQSKRATIIQICADDLDPEIDECIYKVVS